MPKKVTIKRSWIFKTYDCAKEGLSIKDVASLIGIDQRTFKRSKKLVSAMKAGQKICAKNSKEAGFSFSNYVYKKLPGNLKKVWKDITAIEKSTNGVEKVECILNKSGIKVRQYLFIHAWVSSNFCISKAMRKVNISRGMFDRWCQDADFLQLVNEIDICKKDLFEEKLCQLVLQGNPRAIIHVNKTKNRDRGYGDKTILEIQGHVQHSLVSVDVLNTLPLEERQHLLEAVRNHKKQVESREISSVIENEVEQIADN